MWSILSGAYNSHYSFYIITIAQEDDVISEKNIIEWVKLNSVPKMTRIEKKAELSAMIKYKDYMILGYASQGNGTGISSIAKTVGDLATEMKFNLISGHSQTFTEVFFERIQFTLSTNKMIAEKFGVEGGKDAVIVIYNDGNTGYETKVYTVLAKRKQDEKDPMKIQPMIETLKKAFASNNERNKDEL